MTEEKLVILGWNAAVDVSELKQFEAKFARDYDFSVLRSYIMEGNYLGQQPFGVGYDHGLLTIIARDIQGMLSVSSNPLVEIGKKVDGPISMGLDTYAVSVLHHSLARCGYDRPIEVQSFLGRVKGVTRLRTAPILHHKSLFSSTELEFVAYPAEKFSAVVTDTGQVIVMYSPRHEIAETRFGLSTKTMIPDEMVRHASLTRSPQQANARFSTLSSAVSNEHSDLVLFTRLPTIIHQRVERPDLVLPDGTRVQLEEIPDKAFSDVISSAIKPEAPKRVAVLVDQTGGAGKTSEVVNTFIQSFGSFTGFDLHTVFVTSTKDLTVADSSDGAIVILDDSTPGDGPVYDSAKRSLKCPSKVVKISTLTQGEMSRVVMLEYLALRARMTKSLYQVLDNAEYDMVVGIAVIPLRSGRYLVISGTSVENGSIVQRYRLLENDRNSGTPTLDQVAEFLSGLLAGRNLTSGSVLLTSDADVLLCRLDALAENIGCALIHVSEIDAVLLKSCNQGLVLPTDGSYVQFDKNRAILMTNGLPDRTTDEGIPTPVYVEVHRAGNLDMARILQILFDLTFVHPASLAKPKLPLPLHASSSLSVSPDLLFVSWDEMGVFL